jgi:uncharacterized coiled-coil DUF342 family protein
VLQADASRLRTEYELAHDECDTLRKQAQDSANQMMSELNAATQAAEKANELAHELAETRDRLQDVESAWHDGRAQIKQLEAELEQAQKDALDVDKHRLSTGT